MITLARVTTIDNRAARPVAPHFKKLFFARQLRRLYHANSAAVVIDIVKPSKLDDMVRPSMYPAEKWLGRRCVIRVVFARRLVMRQISRRLLAT